MAILHRACGHNVILRYAWTRGLGLAYLGLAYLLPTYGTSSWRLGERRSSRTAKLVF